MAVPAYSPTNSVGLSFCFDLLLSVSVILFFFLAALRSMRDLGSPTRDGTCAPAVEAWNLNHWNAREVPLCAILSFCTSISFNLWVEE